MIGIIGAMDVEIAHLKDQLANRQDHIVAGMSFSSGVLNGVPVVVARSGVGKVNAAVCAQIMIDRYGISALINTGAAGSLDSRVGVGDFVVSSDAVHHDVDATNFGYELGQIPGMPAVAFVADASLVERAAWAVRSATDMSVETGRVVSGDQFVRDEVVKEHIHAQFGALCCEMEGAAIAQTATLNGVPFVIVRAISDEADGSQGMAYDEFEVKAAIDCAHVIERFVSSLGEG